MKKLLSALLCTTMLLGLTACGSPAQSSSAAPVASEASSEPTSQPVSEPASAPSTEPASESSSASTAPTSEGGVLVAYYSATGNTKSVAESIAKPLGAELYEIVPEIPYTADDLNWTVPDSRTNKEHEDPAFRPAIAGEAKDLSGYDTIFIGYPVWWGEAPNIVWNFVESSKLDGKTVIPFCTSSSSGFGSSGDTLKGFAPSANWLQGIRFQSGVAEADVQSWVDGLNLK